MRGRTVLVQGVRRIKIERYLRTEPYLIAKVSYPEATPARGASFLLSLPLAPSGAAHAELRVQEA